jgi:type I restriction enzyme R subunit
LTATDLSELERLFIESGVGNAEDIERAKSESHGLGLFVRSLVGMEREAAKEAIAGFVAGRPLSANQIEFVNLLVDQLTARGVVVPEALYESPFTDITPRGPDGLFDESQVSVLIVALQRVIASAEAAAA